MVNRYDAQTDAHSVFSNAYMTGQTEIDDQTDAMSVRRVEDLSDSDDDTQLNQSKQTTTVSAMRRMIDNRAQSMAPVSQSMAQATMTKSQIQGRAMVGESQASIGSLQSTTEIARVDNASSGTGSMYVKRTATD